MDYLDNSTGKRGDMDEKNSIQQSLPAALAEISIIYAEAVNAAIKALIGWWAEWLNSLSPDVRAVLFSAKSKDDILRALKKARRRKRYLRKYERRGRRMK